MELARRKCLPCEGGIPRLAGPALAPLAAAVPGWQLSDDRIRRHFRFPDFRAALAFVNAVGELAESEGHHPDFCLRNYSTLDVELSTHAAGGLTENDFILAAKIDRLPGPLPG